MSKRLVLAEKPSVARDIARVLNCTKKGGGFFEGDKYVVTWALGHLVTLADPEEYDPKYASWRMEDLPMLPAGFKLVIIKQTGKQYKAVREQLARKDINEVVIATDAGREGELVARWILEKSGSKKPLKRLWISSVTDKAIREGFQRLKDGKEYENLYASAVARAEADWVVGINATRALTCKYNAQLSCGRVQTPTLALIAGRTEEIQHFRPVPYYGLTARTPHFSLTWQDSKSKETRIFDKDRCDKIVAALSRQQARVTEVDKSYRKTPAPLLYDLTELQKDANRLFGFSAKETLSIMQSLYENHKLLTYPRTDSRYLTSDMVDTLGDRMRACGVGPYANLAAKILRAPVKPSKAFVDDSKVTDHHAIIPTEQPAFAGALSERERKIYDLVIRRFFAVLYPPFEYEQTTVRATIGSEHFTAKGKIVLHQGWKAVYSHDLSDEEGQEQNNDDLKDQQLPPVQKGDLLTVEKLTQTSGHTRPPAPLNEGTLLAAMEKGGLGTVATRADIIEKLFKNFLMEKKGQEIHITSKGKQLLELVPAGLKTPQLTATWEQRLGKISRGSESKTKFIGEMRNYAREVVDEIKNSSETFKHDNLTGHKCPDCGKYMLQVNGKKGKMLVCQDRECGHRTSLSRTSNARCPQCHKKLEMRGEGEGQLFVCVCGYREKLSAFTQRKKQEKTSLSKKEVSGFLNQHNRENDKPINSALADALAGFKLKDK